MYSGEVRGPAYLTGLLVERVPELGRDHRPVPPTGQRRPSTRPPTTTLVLGNCNLPDASVGEAIDPTCRHDTQSGDRWLIGPPLLWEYQRLWTRMTLAMGSESGPLFESKGAA